MVKLLKKITFKEFYKTNEKVAKTSPMRTHYISSNPLERWLWKQKKQTIYHFMKNLPIQEVIDLGCGDASLLEVISKNVVYSGIDISPTQLNYATEYIQNNNRNNATVYKGDILNLDFKDDTFDAALACDVVEHVLSPEKLFKEIKRVVKNNGYIIFSIPNETLWELARAFLFRFPLRSPDHIYAVCPKDIYRIFPRVIKETSLPIKFSRKFSLIYIFLIKNVK